MPRTIIVRYYLQHTCTFLEIIFYPVKSMGFFKFLQSPPPPPPPTQMTHVNEEDNGINTSPRMITSEEVRSVEATPTPSPQPPTPSPKPPTPEPTTTTNHKIEDDPKAEVSDSDDHEESDEEILRVTADGRVEMTPSSRGQSQLESPIVPSGNIHSLLDNAPIYLVECLIEKRCLN